MRLPAPWRGSDREQVPRGWRGRGVPKRKLRQKKRGAMAHQEGLGACGETTTPGNAADRTRGRESRAMRTVGGARNEVLQSHPNMCHHCGFHAVPVSNVCVLCGIQYHHGCGPCLPDGGRCDMCEGGGRDRFPDCFLCETPCAMWACTTSTDRLNVRLVYHGMQWRRARASDPVASDVIDLSPDSWVGVQLRRNPRRRFLPRELPERGRRRMRVVIEGQGALESVPMVVHSWCAHCLFDVDCIDEGDEGSDGGQERGSEALSGWRETLLRRMYSCGSRDYGTASFPVTRGGVRCQFCGSDAGWLTFCSYHLTVEAGCDLCRDSTCLEVSRHAFHPSCAVRYGMQRMIRSGHGGMFCARNRVWRAQRLNHLNMWLGMASGINHDLVNPSRLLPFNLTADTTNVDRKGGEYGDSMIPLRHRRRARAGDEEDGGKRRRREGGGGRGEADEGASKEEAARNGDPGSA